MKVSANVDDEMYSKWRNIPTTIIADAAKGAAHLPREICPLRPRGQQPYLFGRAVTVRCAPPGLNAIIQGIAKLRRGDVLVLANDGDESISMSGDIFAGAARRAGCAGLVCDGAIRDTREIAKWDDFSVFSRAVTPFGGVIKEGGAVNVPVKIGSKTVMPGDLVVGDDDGVVVIGPREAESLLPWAQKKVQLEREWIKRLEQGASMLDVFNIPPG
jgi:4-hydroxy-4-methyl-2-oxoglutarate aldolase